MGLYVLGNSCGHVRAISISNHTIPGQAWRPYSLVPFFDQWKKERRKDSIINFHECMGPGRVLNPLPMALR